MILDIGTGDGRAVLARALADPAALVIGIDASAEAMRETSGRAARRGPGNALFLATGAESLRGSPLAGVADLVTVTFPWGSLLRGMVGMEEATLCGVAVTLRPGGQLVVLTSVLPTDHLEGLPELTAACEPAIGSAWARAGLVLTAMVPVGRDEVDAYGSSWARRLERNAGPARPVWRLTGRPLTVGRSLTVAAR